MPGQYSDQATLATLNDFKTLVKAALLKRAVELDDGTVRLTPAQINGINGIINDPDSYTTRMAWLIACTNAAVGAAAPAIPSQSDVQFCVNTLLPKLAR